ncbi:adenosylcobinamide amidohydrolase [Streptomyces prasinopilosus]|uniref:Adenosylcobinamide amidohydrolase n=1 Tax=Streptomyces prasinopilosus TaxID=67344 RepID=A0A1G6YRK6_9ACTN|nr:adenosylcobinamide amidohydrolase [Streptomyces prasinopilosus]SDD92196.1 Adenosylcobinamide amidohydrolase [Streptomyces prasinopilosus]
MTAVLPPPRTFGGLLRPRRLTRVEDGGDLHALLWVPGPGMRMISSAVLGGGIGERHWILNAQVPHGYRRTDPDRHLAELAAGAGARGPGVGLMTAADVSAYAHAHDDGAEAVVTSGVDVRGWAAVPGSGDAVAGGGAHLPGTINIVVALPVPLTDSALVNAVATATEAKTQALLEAGHDCSGTPTDAVCVAARAPSPGEAPHAFAGPRSLWGARLARAVHRAVHDATPSPSPPSF